MMAIRLSVFAWIWLLSTTWCLAQPTPQDFGNPLEAQSAKNIENCHRKFYQFNQEFAFKVKKERDFSVLYLDCRYQGQGEEIRISPLITLPTGTKTYHWGPSQDIEIWIKAGKILQSELTFFINEESRRVLNGEKTLLVQGGGFYTALSPTNSIEFGPSRLTVVADHDLLILPFYWLVSLANLALLQSPTKEPEERLLPQIFHALLAAGVTGSVFLRPTSLHDISSLQDPDFAKKSSATWWFNFFGEEATSHILPEHYWAYVLPARDTAGGLKKLTPPKVSDDVHPLLTMQRFYDTRPVTQNLTYMDINRDYQLSKKKLNSQGIFPAYKIQAAFAPRFIATEDHRDKTLHPRTIYRPESNWKRWENGADFIEAQCRGKFAEKQTADPFFYPFQENFAGQMSMAAIKELYRQA